MFFAIIVRHQEPLLLNVFFGVAIVLIGTVLGRVKVGVRTTGGAIIALWLGLSILVIITQFLWVHQPVDGEGSVTNRPVQMPTGDYVGSAACRSCHPQNHATWHDSYHRTMTQVATEKSVIGNFDNVRLFGKNLSVRLFRQDKQFLVERIGAIPESPLFFPS